MRALTVLFVTALVAPALFLAGCCGSCNPLPSCETKEECCPDKCSNRYSK